MTPLRIAGVAFRWGLAATLLLAPTQWSLRLPGGLHLTPADLALAVAALGWLAERLLTRERLPRPRLPPWPQLAFLALALIAALRAPARAPAFKECLQFAEYFLVAHLLGDEALRRGGPALLRRALRLLLAAGGVVVAFAVWQYVAGPDDPLTVRGTLGNRNVLGGYLALLLPLAGGLAFDAAAPAPAPRGELALLVAAGLLVCLSGPAALAIALALLALAAWRGAARFALVGALLLAAFVWLLPLLPRANDRVLIASAALYDDAGQPARRYPEWQAATVMILERPWFGFGPGAYQRQIGAFYGTVPRATGATEADSQSLPLVLAATVGLPACCCFYAMLLAAAAAAARRGGGLGLGLAAALAAWSLASLWSPLLVRGIGLPLALLLAACRHLPVATGVRGGNQDDAA